MPPLKRINLFARRRVKSVGGHAVNRVGWKNYHSALLKRRDSLFELRGGGPASRYLYQRCPNGLKTFSSLLFLFSQKPDRRCNTSRKTNPNSNPGLSKFFFA